MGNFIALAESLLTRELIIVLESYSITTNLASSFRASFVAVRIAAASPEAGFEKFHFYVRIPMIVPVSSRAIAADTVKLVLTAASILNLNYPGGGGFQHPNLIAPGYTSRALSISWYFDLTVAINLGACAQTLP
ncbi:hypothetical protein TorRG33x02_243630 [Trema orientale]|uniref:Uncharacterized protein n=1 Tax=Trema orientale TaxID=63057 RepID=A0A2P5DSA4_TREOI|nr:hypothetical protein TorRG33x02_243630 [Trema orientale]